jgi:hypothetical protein
MRLELAGSLIRPDPLVIRFDANQNFIPLTYMDLDFTHFEVICIGGGGGSGGGIDTHNTGTLVRNVGGTGGGGGFHRVRGLLSALPTTCPVVVGIGGANGNDHNSDPTLTTDGFDGGYSSFNGTTCQASGGKGGKRAKTNSLTLATHADGGDGGIGGRIAAGGGAPGGIAGDPTIVNSGYPGGDGTLLNNIGKGGGGGAGGLSQYGGALAIVYGTIGGLGSYNPGDTSVYGPRGQPDGGQPGGASGAKASPLNGLPTVYGQSQGHLLPGLPGVVILRLTAE